MLKTHKQVYNTCLSDEQWEVIKTFFPSASFRGRRRSVDLRSVVDAIFYLSRTGCTWRLLPKNFPNYNTVYDYFRQWKKQGLLTKITDHLVERVRVQEGREAKPSKIIIDSQATKAHFGEELGYDGFKKVRGRKRNIVVDTLGLPLAILVDSASKKDHHSAAKMFYDNSMASKLVKTTELYADGGYRCGVDLIVKHFYGINLVLRSSKNIKAKKDPRNRVLTHSNLTPIRWIVERSFAWLNHYRRLSRDYERTVTSSKSVIEIAFIQIMLRRLTRKNKSKRWKKNAA